MELIYIYCLSYTGNFHKKSNLFLLRGFMPSSISSLFMFKLIIETQKYYRKIKILVTKEGEFHFIK